MLSPDLRQALAAAARAPRVVFASDFDGVLAPLQDDPAASRPVPGSIDALRAAAAVPGTTVALVSGRDADTLATISGVGPDDPIVLVASHGAQSSRPDLVIPADLDDGRRTLLRDLQEGLAGIVAAHPQARAERKPTAVVLHTRGIDPAVAAEATRAALDLAERHAGSHVLRGKDVVEIGVVELSKGAALTQLARSVEAQATVYFGDDVTDERAFAVLDPGSGDVTVKVGDGDTLAAHRLDGVPDVLDALRYFAEARAAQA